MLRPELIAVLRPLLAREQFLSLDDIAEAIGVLAVSPDDIDAMFTWLEERGRLIDDPSIGPASAALPRVLTSARSLKAALGRTPNAGEIAEHSGLSREAVQRALLFSRILQR